MMTNIFPKKHLGQNFLVDENIKNRIIEACHFNPKDRVIEIGPGLGALTEKILHRSDHLLAIETDAQLFRKLKEKIQPFVEQHPEKKIKIVHDDFLKYDLSSIPPQSKVVGNLPYNISSLIMEKLIRRQDLFSCFYFTVQLEFAKRLAAKPHSKDYGSLSCFAQYYCDVKILFKIKNTCFRPIPKVVSSFVQMIPREPPHKALNEALLFKIIRQSFQQRRKKFFNSLSSLIKKDRLEIICKECRIDPHLRAENLSLKNFVDIANLEVTMSGK